MEKLLETKDSYIMLRFFARRAHKASLFTTEIYPGLVAEFGNSKNKLNSSQYRLTRLMFSKDKYTKEQVMSFWSNFHVKYISHQQKGRKLPPIYKVVGNPHRLIHNGYIIICKNTDPIRETVLTQKSYEFWRSHFYTNGKLSTDEHTLNAAIPLLIDRIKHSIFSLSDIPVSDNRIFEELVAEIFSGFGYTVELTKKTRDGGKDIIALKKLDTLHEEKILIECKHWKNNIDVNVIRNLIGVACSQEDSPTGVILATTSHFTRDAQKIEIGKTIPIELERKDYDDILEWIQQYDAIQLSVNEANSYFNSLHKV